ncbi:uncharacterized GPI-anchored protein At4g28100 [Impatiens glandulifera]|uniref:uncharacterized GPI-anchored protein At4g28100 n=1 Tax=Impatiens glandulifera TaxID=253017 RepID=UPI001FB14A8D|nr:uncharacterized GPI-anchored protein At4g28100 [Impatiens glandulifera]
MASSSSLVVLLLCLFNHSLASLLAEPAKPPLDDDTTPNTVPAFPVQTTPQICRLDLSEELFGGVKDACGRNLDRSRCCPVLAAWLFAAHARSALQIAPAASLQQSSDLPFIPDDSQKCIDSLETSLQNRNIHIAQPNATCDTALCFCGIRLHQISSLSCPAAFNLTATRNATATATPTPTAAVRELERNCHNSSYAGCTKCLGSLQKLKGGSKNGGDRASKIFSKDCQLMGLTWLLARNKTAYIPTVSAVLRALMYSAHPPHQSKCSPDQENMPLAVNSLQFDKSGSPATTTATIIRHVWFTVLPLIYLLRLL